MNTSGNEDGPDLSRLMNKAGLGNSFQAMTVSALDQAIAKARLNGCASIKRGGSVASLALLVEIRAQADVKPQHDMPLASTAQNSSGPESSSSVSTLPSASAPVDAGPGAISVGADNANANSRVPVVSDQSAERDPMTAQSPRTPLFQNMSTLDQALNPLRSPASRVGGLQTILPAKIQDLFELAIQMENRLSQEPDDEDDISQAKQVESEVDANSDNSGVRTQTHKRKRLEKRLEQEEKTAAKRVKARSTARARRLQEELADRKAKLQRKPRDVVGQASRKNFGNTDYVQRSDKLSKVKSNAAQLQEVEISKTKGPNYFGRTASLAPGLNFDMLKQASNGFTSQQSMVPAATIESGQGLHDSIGDYTQGGLIYMLGHHLMWYDQPSDEFLSWSIDPLFLVVHALDRNHENQSGTTIQFNDRRRAKNEKDQPTDFYPALDLDDTFQVPAAELWKGRQPTRLHARKFTQEFLTHHIVRCEDDQIKPVHTEKLMADGLYEIFPSFRVPPDHQRAGLYGGQMYFRTVGYLPDLRHFADEHPKPIYSYEHCAVIVPFTIALLTRVQSLTRNFMSIADDQDPAEIEPHLHIFISFLTFEKRPRNDEVYTAWIKAHYTAADVLDLYGDGTGGV
ncbi:hypothetical protein LTR78_006972 [Recurvomyces mirabilis]|uniref:Uncharacterized protein n=1 Tax=Recurvomyces mirabilis TaxID=574656 RepID=A0AAE1BZ36_9PEZI|nr:hypothetical protein LTR78_006972 [Recurvomyces mirabilis]KAK5153356.1 hypothetical protein LTS14_007525 [Recurvomyces mirabilis]